MRDRNIGGLIASVILSLVLAFVYAISNSPARAQDDAKKPDCPQASTSDTPLLSQRLQMVVCQLKASSEKGDGIRSSELGGIIAALSDLIDEAERKDPDTDDIKALNDDLKRLADNIPAISNQVLLERLDELAETIDQIQYAHNPTAASHRGADLLIENLNKIAADEAGGLTDKIKTNTNGVINNFLNRIPIKKMISVTEQLIAVLNDDIGDDNIHLILKDKAAVDSVKKLNTKIAPIVAQTNLRVHIVSAIYGDLVAIDHAMAGAKPARGTVDRWCFATAAMKAECDRRTECTGPDNFVADLCGYDPAEFVTPRFRGVAVEYACVANNNLEFWDGAASGSSGMKGLGSGSVQSIVLQSPAQKIICTR